MVMICPGFLVNHLFTVFLGVLRTETALDVGVFSDQPTFRVDVNMAFW